MTFWKRILQYLYNESVEKVWLFIFSLVFLYNYLIELTQHSSNKELKPPGATSQFKVHIYKDELEHIRNWVRQKDHIETGGDLFGLWMDKRNVVVQFVLGPGKNCRRTTTSFYQDIDYLAEVGKFITENHGLCNVGQWHSHHRLDLPRPSTGDEQTVWNNMPNLGIDRFVVFIATIRNSTVNINCFLFEIDETKTQFPVLKGEICVMEHESFPYSPVRMCSNVTDVMNPRMEKDENTENNNSVVIEMETEL